ncbi:MAG: hypothetical protein WA631_05970 [Nitrososphaeraceae archaeon]
MTVIKSRYANYGPNLGARAFSINNLFILSIRAIAKSILGLVTIHICEPDNALSFMQSQAINLSINSENE